MAIQLLPPGADLHLKQWVKLNRLRCGTARVGDTLTLWGVQESATCACGHITQSVQHVVVDCMIHKAPDGFDGLRCPDAKFPLTIGFKNKDALLRRCVEGLRFTSA